MLFFSFSLHDIFLDRSHESFVLAHLLKRVSDILNEKQVAVLRVQLQEYAQVLVVSILGPDSFLHQDSEEVFRLKKKHGEGLRLSLDILLEDHFLEELLSGLL